MDALAKQRLKKAINALLIVGTFVVVIALAVKSGDIHQVWAAVQKARPRWLLVGLLSYIVYASAEGGSLFLFFRMQGLRIRLGPCLSAGLIGMYYSSITPAATGGQPMQVFALKKHGVPPGLSSSALAVKFIGWQTVLILLGFGLWVRNPALVSDSLKDARYLLYVGFFVNSLTVVGVLLIALMRNVVRSVIIFLVRFFHKLRLVKDVAATSSRWDAALSDFNASVDVLRKKPLQFVAMLLINLVELLALLSCAYFVYRGLGLSGHRYIDILTVSVMLYISASITPLPGASGAQEGGFYLFFRPFFPPAFLTAGLLIWRFLTYYLSLIVGFLAVMAEHAVKNRRCSPQGERDA